jgi:hypothetical protein
MWYTQKGLKVQIPIKKPRVAKKLLGACSQPEIRERTGPRVLEYVRASRRYLHVVLKGGQAVLRCNLLGPLK